MIEPKEFEVNDKNYILSKFPAVDGREIMAVYISSGLPKIGDYKSNEQIMFKLMSYVGVPTEGNNFIRLNTKALIDNHIKSWEALLRIEAAMMEYNCSFFQNGWVSNFLRDAAQKLPAWITKILTNSLEQLSKTEKPPSTN